MTPIQDTVVVQPQKKSRSFTKRKQKEAKRFLSRYSHKSILWDIPGNNMFPFTDYAIISRELKSVDPMTQTELALQMKFLDPEAKIKLRKPRRNATIQNTLLYFQGKCIVAKDEDSIKKTCGEFLIFFKKILKSADTSTQRNMCLPKEGEPFHVTKRLLIRSWMRLISHSAEKLQELENVITKGEGIYSTQKKEFLFWGNELNLTFPDTIALYEQLFSILPETEVREIISSIEDNSPLYWKKAIGIIALSR